MAKDFFKSLFERNIMKPPRKTMESFRRKYPGAHNIEWHKHEDVYEAIFYIDEIEIISKFSSAGKWLETGTNLHIHEIPENIKAAAELHGEIMNSIEFEREGLKKYEIIIRDTQLTRYLLIITEQGEIIKHDAIV
jgi:hypothetical protein